LGVRVGLRVGVRVSRLGLGLTADRRTATHHSPQPDSPRPKPYAPEPQPQPQRCPGRNPNATLAQP